MLFDMPSDKARKRDRSYLVAEVRQRFEEFASSITGHIIVHGRF